MGTLKEIKNRYYKECNIVMLPTKDETNIVLNTSTEELSYTTTKKLNIRYKVFTYQHLYIVSDDEIKEGDWFISSENKIYHAIRENFDDLFSILKDLNYSTIWKSKGKIITTTDKSLMVQDYFKNGRKAGLEQSPQPSQSFIKKYCELGDVDKVLVEYEFNVELYKNTPSIIKNSTYGSAGQYKLNFYKLKTDSHNTITIKSVKDSWTREEVIDLLKIYQEDFCNFEAIKPGLEKLKNTINLPEYWKDWIKENL